MGKPAILLSSVPWPRKSNIEKETVRIVRFDRVEERVLNLLAALLKASIKKSLLRSILGLVNVMSSFGNRIQ